MFFREWKFFKGVYCNPLPMNEEVYVHYAGQYRFGMLGEGQDLIVERYLRRHKGSKFLHVGCSSNPVINRNVSSLVSKVVCGDLLLPATNLRKQNIVGVIPVAMDVFEIPFKDDTFDLILAVGIPPLYEAPVKGLRELHRVNSPRGLLLVCNRDGGGDVCIDQYKGMAEATEYHILDESVGFDRQEKTNRYLLVLQK